MVNSVLLCSGTPKALRGRAFFGPPTVLAGFRAHAEVFTEIRPVTTVMEVTGFVVSDWLVEIELDAVLKDPNT